MYQSTNYRGDVRRSKSLLVGLILLGGLKLGYVLYRNHAGASTEATTSSSTTIAVPTTTTQPNVPVTQPYVPITWPSGTMAESVTLQPSAPGVLDGKTVVIDPGHNGLNWSHPSIINQLVPDGHGTKACDTTGTSTNNGYSEASFSFTVAERLQTLLRAEGAVVILTRSNNQSVGPCVNVRAATGPTGDVAISIHGDGGPSSGHGFAVLVPVFSATNSGMVAPSRRFGDAVVSAFAQVMPISTYLGSHGIQPRSDLAGLNLSAIPKVFIEAGNMRNAADATLMQSPAWQQRAAVQLATAIRSYLVGGP